MIASSSIFKQSDFTVRMIQNGKREYIMNGKDMIKLPGSLGCQNKDMDNELADCDKDLLVIPQILKLACERDSLPFGKACCFCSSALGG